MKPKNRLKKYGFYTPTLHKSHSDFLLPVQHRKKTIDNLKIIFPELREEAIEDVLNFLYTLVIKDKISSLEEKTALKTLIFDTADCLINQAALEQIDNLIRNELLLLKDLEDLLQSSNSAEESYLNHLTTITPATVDNRIETTVEAPLLFLSFEDLYLDQSTLRLRNLLDQHQLTSICTLDGELVNLLEQLQSIVYCASIGGQEEQIQSAKLSIFANYGTELSQENLLALDNVINEFAFQDLQLLKQLEEGLPIEIIQHLSDTYLAIFNLARNQANPTQPNQAPNPMWDLSSNSTLDSFFEQDSSQPIFWSDSNQSQSLLTVENLEAFTQEQTNQRARNSSHLQASSSFHLTSTSVHPQSIPHSEDTIPPTTPKLTSTINHFPAPAPLSLPGSSMATSTNSRVATFNQGLAKTKSTMSLLELSKINDGLTK